MPHIYHSVWHKVVEKKYLTEYIPKKSLRIIFCIYLKIMQGYDIGVRAD